MKHNQTNLGGVDTLNVQPNKQKTIGLLRDQMMASQTPQTVTSVMLLRLFLIISIGTSAQIPNACSNEDLGNKIYFGQRGFEGQVLKCPNQYFMVGSCSSGKNSDCGSGANHGIHCRKYGFIDDVVVGRETDWIGSIAKRNSPSSWSWCGEDQIITSRCASGKNRDCKLTDGSFHHGIRCRALGWQFYIQNREHWVCAKYGRDDFCPDGYFPVASCGAGQNPDCGWSGCSGTKSWNGLKCQQWGYLKNFTWDYSNKPQEFIEIVQDINPIVGRISSLDLEFETKAEAEATSSYQFKSEYGLQVGLEVGLLSKKGFPKFKGSSGGIGGFAQLNVDTQLTEEKSFEAAASAQVTSTLSIHKFSYSPNPTRSASENFVRFVHYKRRQMKDVIGTAKCCNCENPESTITVHFETVQSGMLALHVKNYPDLDLEQISGIEFVELYLNGTIVDYGSGPKRSFVDS